jgi:carbonic anhydrase/acetyltransferase-like protein (isoleucine patch superfamily)
MIRDFLGARPSFDSSNFIAQSANLIGDVTLGSESSVWFNATIRGDVNWIRIGSYSNVQDNAVVHVTNRTAPVTIGDSVTIGHSAVVHGCRIHDRVLVGIGAILLDHADVGEGSIIGAGALVTSRTVIPPGSLVLGTPARVVRRLTDDEIASILEYAENYRRYSRIYRGAERPAENPFYNRQD